MNDCRYVVFVDQHGLSASAGKLPAKPKRSPRNVRSQQTAAIGRHCAEAHLR